MQFRERLNREIRDREKVSGIEEKGYADTHRLPNLS